MLTKCYYCDLYFFLKTPWNISYFNYCEFEFAIEGKDEFVIEGKDEFACLEKYSKMGLVLLLTIQFFFFVPTRITTFWKST